MKKLLLIGLLLGAISFAGTCEEDDEDDKVSVSQQTLDQINQALEERNEMDKQRTRTTGDSGRASTGDHKIDGFFVK